MRTCAELLQLRRPSFPTLNSSLIFVLTCYLITAIMCPIPRPIANGGFTGNGFGVSDSVDFYCINGFQLSGAPKLTCQEDGTWDLPLPFCEGWSRTVVSYSSLDNGTVHTC